MRDWNDNGKICIDIDDEVFVEYLWGIETIYAPNFPNHKLILFVEYLWGIETLIPQYWSGKKKRRFVEYLWGIETVR